MQMHLAAHGVVRAMHMDAERGQGEPLRSRDRAIHSSVTIADRAVEEHLAQERVG